MDRSALTQIGVNVVIALVLGVASLWRGALMSEVLPFLAMMLAMAVIGAPHTDRIGGAHARL